MNNESMVYLNKVFSDLKVKSCPLMTGIVADSTNFNQQLTFFDGNNSDSGCSCSCDCGCGCNCSCNCNCGGTSPIDGDDDLNYVVESTEVIISDFDLACPSELSACNVTVDGMPVDGLDFFNERYMAGTNNLMSKISDCTCMERGLSTKAYLLICNVGNWNAKLTIAVRGSVFGCGSCRRFKLLMTTKDGYYVNVPGLSTFAASSICLPCTTGGIAPVINFSFHADGTLLNPEITSDPQTGGQCGLRLTGCLITEPIAEVQVTRQTLFRTNAESVNVPCDDIDKCREFPGVCGEDDDFGSATAVRNKCCEEECEPQKDDSGCGCCGNSSSGRNSRRSISCQYNGFNGFNF